MSDAAPNWKAWKEDFVRGRTHVAYGLITSSCLTAAGAILAPSLILRTLFTLSALASLGSLVDTVAHLYYH